jgi:hypothetical protein
LKDWTIQELVERQNALLARQQPISQERIVDKTYLWKALIPGADTH